MWRWFQACYPKRKQLIFYFLFFINSNVFSALSSLFLLLQCKILVDALATIADSTESLVELLKVTAERFFQVTHPNSWRMYGLFKLERKKCLISEHEVNLASCCLVTWVLKLARIFLLGLLTDLVYQRITPQCWSEVIWAGWGSRISTSRLPHEVLYFAF